MATVKSDSILPTKKQRELLRFIQAFITEHGYSPSYREIKTGLNYNSVATVALHVNNLMKRGHLRKRDRSARSLEVVEAEAPVSVKTNRISADEEKWLVQKVDYLFSEQERQSNLSTNQLDQLYVLVGALKVLGLDAAAQSFIPRLTTLKAAASK